MSGIPDRARILDIGCGPGQQTIHLAELHSGATIVAVDTHRPYLDRLRARSVTEGVAGRVAPVLASMFTIPFGDACADGIWAEGSIYIIGFERGLREWKRLLKSGGYIAVTHLSWLTSEVPDEPRAFWANNYPAIATVEANLSIARASGFETVEHFALPQSAWWDDYYSPMEQRLSMLRAQYENDEQAVAVIEHSRTEIDLYRRFATCYGYVFYVLRAL
jgi:ubiquinone/menaquinone biosynthesis C-methylase UbiE